MAHQSASHAKFKIRLLATFTTRFFFFARVQLSLLQSIKQLWRQAHPPPPKKEKQTCFMGGRTCQVGSVGWAFFLFSGSKNDPKNTKNWKKILTLFAEKFWENILTIFKNFQLQFFRFWSKNDWFYKILEKLEKKKKSAKAETLGQSCP